MEEEIIVIEDDDIEEIDIEEENYSGKPYELPIASKDVLGGIKVGENLTITEDGTLNATGEITGEYEETDPTVPAHVKAITQAQIEQWNNGTGDIDLTDYAKKSELPTKVSELTNDSGFISEIPSEYVTETDYATREKAGLIRANINTNTDVWQDYLYGVVNSYEQYQEKDRTAFVSKGTLDNVLEAKDYLTEHQDISGKQDKLVSGENIKTINGNSLLGEGNIVIEGGSGNSNNVGTYIQIYNSETLWLEPETITKLDFDNENKNTTNGGLIFEDSGVRVGKGVSQLLIIAKWNNWQYDFSKYIYIYKNGSTYEMQPYYTNVYSANITSYMDVIEGDYIEIYGYHNDTERQNINSSPFSSDAKIIIMR